MNTLIEHLEHFLGPIAGGWSKDADGNELPFQVVRFTGGPIAGVITLCTLGLSKTPLAIDDAGKRVRQELVLLVREEYGARNLPGVIQQLGLKIQKPDRAYRRGEVIGPRGRLIDEFALEALYVAIPIYFPDEFHAYHPPTGDPVVFAWLVPIYASEARFVRERDWNAFEELLEREDPDLLDFRRPALV